MPARGSGIGWRRLMAAGIAAALALLCASELPAQNYIQDDAKISGAEVYTFAYGPERVTLVLGNFQFQSGGRRVTSREAAVWIRTTSAGRPHEAVASRR